jgi:hypothetical protein
MGMHPRKIYLLVADCWRLQFMLVGSIILVTISVSLGLGKHSYLVPPQNFGTLGLIGNITGTFSILAATWSKTSFALTLLRLMQGRMQYVLWFIIVTINIFMGLNAVFMWVRCAPVQKTWNPFAYGTCWDPQVYPNYGMFAAGKTRLSTRQLLAVDRW